MKLFLDTHEHLPLLDNNTADNINVLNKYYNVELISAYPHLSKRVENLLYHDINYHKLICDIHNKADYVLSQEKIGIDVVAILKMALIILINTYHIFQIKSGVPIIGNIYHLIV